MLAVLGYVHSSELTRAAQCFCEADGVASRNCPPFAGLEEDIPSFARKLVLLCALREDYPSKDAGLHLPKALALSGKHI